MHAFANFVKVDQVQQQRDTNAFAVHHSSSPGKKAAWSNVPPIYCWQSATLPVTDAKLLCE